MKKQTTKADIKRTQRKKLDLGPITFESVFGEPLPSDSKANEQWGGISGGYYADAEVPSLIQMWSNDNNVQPAGNTDSIGTSFSTTASRFPTGVSTADDMNPLEGPVDLSLPNLARELSVGGSIFDCDNIQPEDFQLVENVCEI